MPHCKEEHLLDEASKPLPTNTRVQMHAHTDELFYIQCICSIPSIHPLCSIHNTQHIPKTQRYLIDSFSIFSSGFLSISLARWCNERQPYRCNDFSFLQLFTNKFKHESVME